jgi:phospholipid/cholesterol/gamma-HCH transport system permease protein
VIGALTGAVGRATLSVVGGLGELSVTGFQATQRLIRSALPGERFRLQASLDQMYLVGASAVPIVALISFMIGLILAFQSAYQLERLGAERYIAALVSVAITRELGPVITAIVVAGRSGSAIAAEISSMKIQEELDALEVMGVDALAYLVSPRLLAMLITLPLLVALGDAVGIVGGLVTAVFALHQPAQLYIDTAREALHMRDFASGLIKAGVFGVVIVTVSAWCGFTVEGGPEGVGRATTRAVVLGIFLVIVADLVFTGFFYNFG